MRGCRGRIWILGTANSIEHDMGRVLVVGALAHRRVEGAGGRSAPASDFQGLWPLLWDRLTGRGGARDGAFPLLLTGDKRGHVADGLLPSKRTAPSPAPGRCADAIGALQAASARAPHLGL